MGTNDLIQDAQVSHQIGLQRFSNSTVRKVLKLLRQMEPRISEELLREGLTDLSRERQSRLLRVVRGIIDGAYEEATGQILIDVEALTNYEVEYQLNMLERVIPLRLEWVQPSPATLNAVVNSRPFQGRIMKDWLTKYQADARTAVRNTIRQSIVEGRGAPEVVRQLRGTRANGYRDGILSTQRRHAETIVRTAMSHTANSAKSTLIKQNKSLISPDHLRTRIADLPQRQL